MPYSLSSGFRMSNHSTVIAPARPAYAEDTANAPALARITLTPITAAAASLSRTARHDRPIRPLTAPRAMTKASTVSSRNRYQVRSACWIGTPRISMCGPSLLNGKPNSENGVGARPVDVPPVSFSADCPK